MQVNIELMCASLGWFKPTLTRTEIETKLKDIVSRDYELTLVSGCVESSSKNQEFVRLDRSGDTELCIRFEDGSPVSIYIKSSEVQSVKVDGVEYSLEQYISTLENKYKLMVCTREEVTENVYRNAPCKHGLGISCWTSCAFCWLPRDVYVSKDTDNGDNVGKTKLVKFNSNDMIEFIYYPEDFGLSEIRKGEPVVDYVKLEESKIENSFRYSSSSSIKYGKPLIQSGEEIDFDDFDCVES